MVHQPATPAGSVHKSRGDNVVRMWVMLKRWCECYRGGHSGDGCVLASTLCKYALRKGAMSEAGNSLFRAASVW